MKKLLLTLITVLIILPMVFFSGCSPKAQHLVSTAMNELSRLDSEETAKYVESDHSNPSEDNITRVSENAESEYALDEYGAYTDPYDVAEYLYTYHKLPSNYITKGDAQKLGWDSSKGNLHEVAPGMSIGGDYFGNYEGLLPNGDYRECDVNYHGGFRGGERLIYSDEFSVYYTIDHYKSFTQLY